MVEINATIQMKASDHFMMTKHYITAAHLDTLVVSPHLELAAF